jgi:hypothetical protein
MIPKGHLSPERIERMLVVLENLFCRGTATSNLRAHGDAFDYLMVPLARGDIRAVRRRIPVAICAQATPRLHSSGGESSEHLYMKRAGVLWMRANGAEDAMPEVRMGYFRFDGHSEKEGWAIEVGNTSAMKLKTAIQQRWLRRFTLVPFQGHWDIMSGERPSRGLTAIDFEWPDGLKLESPL